MRPVASLSLPRFLKQALADANYRTTHDLSAVSSEDLALELNIGQAQAEDVLRQCREPEAGPSRPSANDMPVDQSATQSATAAELLTKVSSRYFSTLSTSLDDIISNFGPHHSDRVNGEKRFERPGSIHPGMVLEIAGPPGIGKTAIACALALSARLQALEKHGEELVEQAGEVLIVDTEGGVSFELMERWAQTLTRVLPVSPRQLLDGIHLIRVATQVQMVALLHTLDQWLREHPQVDLVIIDTLSYHFRQPGLDMNVRRRVMELAKQEFAKASTTHGCAVVVTNQLATKLLSADNQPANFDNGDRAVLMPQLGDMWTTSKTIRLVLFRDPKGDGGRWAHASTPDVDMQLDWAAFDIGGDGLPRDRDGLPRDRDITPAAPVEQNGHDPD